MRIRIIEPRPGRIDGVDLSVFQSGYVYEVDPTVATYLVVTGVAVPCGSGVPARVMRSNEVMVGVFAGLPPLADVSDDREDDPKPPA